MSDNSETSILAGLIVNSLAEMSRQRQLYGGGGQPGNTKRTKLWDEFGYPTELTFEHYYKMYERNAVAFGAVHKLLEGCWSDFPVIVDGDEEKESKETTPWEKGVTKFMKKHWAKVKDADRRNLVGHYSALLLQVRDGKTWDQPIAPGSLRRLGDKGLVRFIPAWESQLTPSEWQNDQTADDYGQPIMFNFDERPVGNSGIQGPARGVRIHPDRVIIFCEGSEDESIFSGIPLLRAAFNKLLDLEKTSGGSAEGFLKNASRQLGINFSAQTDMAAIERMAKAAGYDSLAQSINEQTRKLNRGIDDGLFTQDAQATVLSVTPADPGPTWEVTANEVSCALLCPFTIQFGQQTGRLASDEDKTDWAKRCNGRRNGFQTDRVMLILERLWTFGIIDPPTSGEVTLTWADLLAPSEKDKIANGKELAAVAESTQKAFGTSAIEPNQILAAMELDPLPENENQREIPPGDPLTDANPSGAAANTPKQSGPNAIKPPRQQDAA